MLDSHGICVYLYTPIYHWDDYIKFPKVIVSSMKLLLTVNKIAKVIQAYVNQFRVICYSCNICYKLPFITNVAFAYISANLHCMNLGNLSMALNRLYIGFKTTKNDITSSSL